MMKENIGLITHLLVEFFEKIKGARVLTKTELPSESNSELKIVTNLGHAITIFCRETHYRMRFNRWWIPDTRRTIYHVHCVCDKDTPSDIKKRFHYDGHIPRFTTSLLPSSTARWKAIEAYIDDALMGTLASRTFKN